MPEARIFYAILDRRNLISDERVRHYIDDGIEALRVDFNDDLFIATTIDEILRVGVERGFTHACLFGSGHFSLRHAPLITAVEEFCKTDFYVAGHILMRGDQYPHLHYQMIIVDLARHRAFGCPTSETVNGQALPAVFRSPENVHDDYTPLWLRRGDGSVVPPKVGYAQGLIAAGLVNDAPVVNIPREIRALKRFLYPEIRNAFGDALDAFMARKPYSALAIDHAQRAWLDYLNETRDHASVFLFNSERMEIKPIAGRRDGPANRIAVVAAGFKPLAFWKHYGSQNTTMVWYDAWQEPLSFWSIMIDEWNGCDLRGFLGRRFRWLDPFGTGMVLGSKRRGLADDEAFDAGLRDVHDLFGGPDVFIDTWEAFRRIKHEFRRHDLLRNGVSGMDLVDGDVLWFSNIFCFNKTIRLNGARYVRKAFDIFVDQCQATPGLACYGLSPDREKFTCLPGGL